MRSKEELAAKNREYTRQYRERNREALLAKDRATKAAIPIEIKRATNAKWRATVSDEWREAKREYNRNRCRRLAEGDPDYYSKLRMANLERARERDRARYQRHRAKIIAENSRIAKIRRVRLAGNRIYRVSEREWLRLIARYGGCCAYCGQPSAVLHHDHVVPVARGGHHSIGNLLPACPPCNRSKGKRFLVEWRARQRRGLAA